MDDGAHLVFVYNAQSGLLSALKDGLHKALRPETYPCSLCALTYGAVSMKRPWATFIASLHVPVLFRYRDTARRWIPAGAALPLLLRVHDDDAEILLSAEDLDALETLDALMDAVRQVI